MPQVSELVRLDQLLAKELAVLMVHRDLQLVLALVVMNLGYQKEVVVYLLLQLVLELVELVL